MKILSAKYLRSIAVTGETRLLDDPEFCFVGRSNVGKSSMINRLVMQKVARTSSTPGATKMINIYELVCETGGTRKRLIFSDFPGFGYSKVSRNIYQGWQGMVENYLVNNRFIKKLIWVYDVRREIDETDEMLIRWLHRRELDYTFVLTKVDKVNKSETYMKKKSFENLFGNREVFTFSSKDGYGRTELLSHILNVIK
jgi:GTP-binding protein